MPKKPIKLKEYKPPKEKFVVIVEPWGVFDNYVRIQADLNRVSAWIEVMLSNDTPGARPSCIYYQNTHRYIIVELPREVDTRHILGAHKWSEFLHKPVDKTSKVYNYNYRRFGDPGERQWACVHPTYLHSTFTSQPIKKPYPFPYPLLEHPPTDAPYAQKISSEDNDHIRSRLKRQCEPEPAGPQRPLGPLELLVQSLALSKQRVSQPAVNEVANADERQDHIPTRPKTENLARDATPPSSAYGTLPKREEYSPDIKAFKKEQSPDTKIKKEELTQPLEVVPRPPKLPQVAPPIKLEPVDEPHRDSTKLKSKLDPYEQDDLAFAALQPSLNQAKGSPVKSEAEEDYKPDTNLLDAFAALPGHFFTEGDEGEDDDEDTKPLIKPEPVDHVGLIQPWIKPEPEESKIPIQPLANVKPSARASVQATPPPRNWILDHTHTQVHVKPEPVDNDIPSAPLHHQQPAHRDSRPGQTPKLTRKQLPSFTRTKRESTETPIPLEPQSGVRVKRERDDMEDSLNLRNDYAQSKDDKSLVTDPPNTTSFKRIKRERPPAWD